MLFFRNVVSLCLAVVALACCAALVSCVKQPAEPGTDASAGASQQLFATPEDAVVAMIDASRTGNFERLVPIFGSAVADLAAETKEKTEGDMQRLAAAYDRAHALFVEEDGSITLQVDTHNWEFPAPLVQVAGGWRFDTEAGIVELKARRMDKNQEDAVGALQDCVEAQELFRAMNLDGGTPAAFASRFLSTPGNRDGLWWADELGLPMSPLGPSLAVAIEAGDLKADFSARPRPYFGYYFRMLRAAGPAAAGGAMNFTGPDGRQTLGFAVVAWPAEYGKDGMKSFIVSADGRVYEKDLGSTTSELALAMVTFDPGAGWAELPIGQ